MGNTNLKASDLNAENFTGKTLFSLCPPLFCNLFLSIRLVSLIAVLQIPCPALYPPSNCIPYRLQWDEYGPKTAKALVSPLFVISKSVCLFLWSVGVKKGSFLTFSFICFCSCFKRKLCLPLLHRQRWVRQSLASRKKKGQIVLRHERNEQGKNHNKAQRKVRYQWETNFSPAQKPLHRQHVLCLLRPWKSVPSHGLFVGRRSTLSHLPKPTFWWRGNS